MYNSDPYEEGSQRVESFLQVVSTLLIFINKESIPDNDEHHDHEGYHISITPEHYLVACETLDLLEILKQEVCTSKEKYSLKHDVIESKHIRGQFKELSVIL